MLGVLVVFVVLDLAGVSGVFGCGGFLAKICKIGTKMEPIRDLGEPKSIKNSETKTTQNLES